jgi:hypothetical protein
MIKFGEPRPVDNGGLVPLYVPPGGQAFLREIGEMISARAAMFEDVFKVSEYAPGHDFPIGPLTFTFHPVQHYVPSHAMRVRSSAGATLVFSSDVGPCRGLV